ncbi:hypothetical protein [Nevskia ramosa]|uniref:hypothetical protein n=1 Tax=Nevskia ramosa TaxID=64002 RepID=UPI0023536D00|nr:hypothetical protein [Nevskia ramosa]
MNPQAAKLRRSRLTLVLLGALFIGPLIAAWVLYSNGMRPTLTTNYGELVLPTQPLPKLEFRNVGGEPMPELLTGRWSLVQLGAATCDAACSDRLVLGRQTRLALGAVGINKDRLQLVYIVPDAAAATAAVTQLSETHKILHIVADSGAPGQRAEDVFKPSDPLALYLIDPNGNWLMTYKDQADADKLQRGLLDDLKKLLKLSSIG